MSERTYHTDSTSSYPMPNDGPELQRLRRQHLASIALVHNNPIHAPLALHSPKKILDIGCGVNADMTIILAEMFPEAIVYGVDLSTVDLGDKKPSNVEFIKGNIKDLAGKYEYLQLGSFDYIFNRFMMGVVPDWRPWIQEVVAPLLTPGGWVEFHDFPGFDWYDSSGRLVSAEWEWVDLILMQWTRLGYKLQDRQLKTQLDDILMEAGLDEIHRKWYRAYWAPVPGRPETEVWGKYAPTIGEAIHTAGDKLYPGDENEELRADIHRGVEETLMQSREDMYWPMIVAWARRPDF